MAYGAEVSKANPLVCTIQIWPSSELTAQSWHWPEHWHAAYLRFSGRLGLAITHCVLGGEPLSETEIETLGGLGHAKFTITRTGDSIQVIISDFTGPEAPGPDGGARQQPRAIGGLVLGLRGSGRYFRLVVFHGFMPPLPINDLISSERDKSIFCFIDRDNLFDRAGEILSVIIYPEPTQQLTRNGSISASDTRENVEILDHWDGGSKSRTLLAVMLADVCTIQFRKSSEIQTKEIHEHGLFYRALRRQHSRYDCIASSNCRVWVPQSQSNYVHDRYLH